MKRRLLLVLLLVFVLSLSVLVFVNADGTATEQQTPQLKITDCTLSFDDSVYIMYALPVDSAAGAEVKILYFTDAQDSLDGYNYENAKYCESHIGTQSVPGRGVCYVYKNKHMNAKNMTDVVYARAYAKVGDTEYYSNVVKYSILEYAYNMLGKTTSYVPTEKLERLLTKMLEYGAEAQNYFGYKADRLATDAFYKISLSGATLADGSKHGFYKQYDEVTLYAEDSSVETAWYNSQNKLVGVGTTLIVEVENKHESYTAKENNNALNWKIEAESPLNDSEVDVVNASVRQFYDGFDLNANNTEDYRTGVDAFAPREVSLKWSVGEEALYYKLCLSENADMSSPVRYLLSECETSIVNLKTGADYYWYVDAVYADYTVRSAVFNFRTAEGPRTLAVEGVSNIRDFGGYITEDGLRIKQGMIYRSAKLDDITPEGRYAIENLLKIKTDLDLRGEDDGTQPTSLNYVNVAAPHYAGSSGIWASETNKSEFAKAVKVFADESNYPIVFHCALGRDRTGTLAMVLGGLLGLDADTLMMEYDLSAFSYQGSLGSSTYSQLRTQIYETYEYINDNYDGADFSERVESFLIEIGVSAIEIQSIKDIMLEEVE